MRDLSIQKPLDPEDRDLPSDIHLTYNCPRHLFPLLAVWQERLGLISSETHKE